MTLKLFLVNREPFLHTKQLILTVLLESHQKKDRHPKETVFFLSKSSGSAVQKLLDDGRVVQEGAETAVMVQSAHGPGEKVSHIGRGVPGPVKERFVVVHGVGPDDLVE